MFAVGVQGARDFALSLTRLACCRPPSPSSRPRRERTHGYSVADTLDVAAFATRRRTIDCQGRNCPNWSSPGEHITQDPPKLLVGLSVLQPQHILGIR